MPGDLAGQTKVVRPTWEQPLLALFDDLEQQAEGLHLEDRRQEVQALAAADFAEVTLESRLLASLGVELTVRAAGGLVVRGRVLRAGSGWVLLRDVQDRAWLCPLSAMLSVAGLTARAAAPSARTVLGRLGLGSALRALALRGDDCLVHLVDAQRLEGRLARVGGDFVEVVSAGVTHAVPVSAISAVRGVP